VIGSPRTWRRSSFQGRAVLASDIYSVGVLFYQMLTGTLPYFSPTRRRSSGCAQGRCTPPKIRNSQVPKEISDIVMKAIAPKNLGERYQRATELLDDLGTATDIDIGPPSSRNAQALEGPGIPKKGFCWHCRSPSRRPTAARFAASGNDAPSA